MSKKKIFIGIAAGLAVVGGAVALIAKHNRKKYLSYEDEYEDDDIDEMLDDYWDDELDEDSADEDNDEISPELEKKINQYTEAAEQLLRELENGTYGR